MEALGWIGPQRPRLVAVQANGCQRSSRLSSASSRPASCIRNAHTIAAGLRVPKPLGDSHAAARDPRQRRHGDRVSDEAISADD